MKGYSGLALAGGVVGLTACTEGGTPAYSVTPSDASSLYDGHPSSALVDSTVAFANDTGNAALPQHNGTVTGREADAPGTGTAIADARLADAAVQPPFEIDASADEGGNPTCLGSETPEAFRSASSILSTIALTSLFRRQSTDTGSWRWEYDLQSVTSGWARARFYLIDQNISAELQATGNAFEAYVWCSVEMPIDLEFHQVGVSDPVRYRVYLPQGVSLQWARISIPAATLLEAGLDVTDIATIGLRAVAGVSAQSAELYLSMVDC